MVTGTELQLDVTEAHREAQRADVRIQSQVGPFQNGGSVQGSARESGMAATSDTWKSVVDKGVEDLIRNLRAKLASR